MKPEETCERLPLSVRCESLLARVEELERENEQMQSELWSLKSHDDAPCVFCDPLRQQLARALQDNANLRAALKVAEK